MKSLKDSLAVFLAAGVGGWLRYQVSLILSTEAHFPWATLLVNLIGTFLLIYLVNGYLKTKKVAERLTLALGTGFCGGLTTFSGFLLDSLKLAEKDAFLELALYFFLTLVGGFLIALLARKWVTP